MERWCLAGELVSGGERCCFQTVQGRFCYWVTTRGPATGDGGVKRASRVSGGGSVGCRGRNPMYMALQSS